MRSLVTLTIATAAFLTTSTAIAAPATPGPNAAAQAYRQEVRRECHSGVFSQTELHNLYAAARASGDHGYLPSPIVAQDSCEQAP
jgi:hypothetical protein